jgi:O-methyltransferase
MRFPTYPEKTARLVANSADRVRYGTLALALQTIERERVSGDLAELGVWRGATSTFLHSQMPQRTLYLFDTFAGFPGESDADGRFRDTSVDAVRRRIGDNSNVIFRVGTFPGTALGMESERFAFVLLDADKYAATLAGLEFFYPRMTPGGYMFIHDYNSPESEHGVSRAVNEFLQGKLERIVEIPDIWGSVLFRKL